MSHEQWPDLLHGSVKMSPTRAAKAKCRNRSMVGDRRLATTRWSLT